MRRESSVISQVNEVKQVKQGKRRKQKIGVVEAGITYIAALVVLMTLAGVYRDIFEFYSFIATQLTLLAIPIVILLFRKAKIQQILRLYRPTLKSCVTGVILWIGVFFVVNGLTQLLMPFIASSYEVNQELAQVTYHPNILINLVVVALIPAICEETLFRGIIFRGLSNQYTTRVGLVVSSLLFGSLHFDLIRMIPTTILGLGMGYAVYRSNSLFVGILIHFLNNAVIVIVNHNVSFDTTVQTIETIQPVWYVIGAVVLMIIGTSFIRMSQKRGYSKVKRKGVR